ncbi:FISUMP domain-containing protein [Fibrobacter sp. UWB11]|uniref:FISUMP domain-containing protein n=1 Tax=Fibrobacter sp. UWB11 TaxID=1896202 RepID=UPI000925A572|nr:FISUMP domain-containing protein [Fibrobacter sp. UWB11]SIO39129.1 major paralogous domain-containing protein [Fibrobacter sp. UWB11]
MNYLKISGQLVCKMAMLLAFMFAACSETNSGNNVAGGTVEETGVYALAGRVGDVYPKLLKVADPSGEPTDTAKYEGSVFAEKGSIIIVYELDSLTLDTTGRFFKDTVDNDSGRFEFKEMNLRSPYVLIGEHAYPSDARNKRGTIVYTYYNYSAIVDLRNVKNVNVSTLTTMKVPLLQKYFAEGKSFAEAGKMAEHEILEGFGIYEDLGTFEEMPENGSELDFVNELSQLDELNVRHYVETMGVVLSFMSPKEFSKSEIMERYYLNSMKMIDYDIGYLAHIDSLGRCTESRENEASMVKGRIGDIAVVCRSGKWAMGFKAVEHTKGTMTDNRDGKTYKTVTYNFGGTSQTWMTENLDFTDTASLSVDSSLRANLSGSIYCYHEPYLDNDEEGCGAYGHEYLWRAAMNIGDDDIKSYSVGAQGDSLLVSEKCMDAIRNRSLLPGDSAEAVEDSCGTILYGENDSEENSSRTWTWNYSDFITPSNQNSYQGICPDGWRIPTLEDWLTLLQNLGEQYGVDYGNVVMVLYDEAATGFGLNNIAKILGVEFDHVVVQGFSFYNYFVMADASYYTAEFFNMWKKFSGFNLSYPDRWHVLLYKYNNPEMRQSSLADPYTSAAVRCIKN